jgi:hypothetical protein
MYIICPLHQETMQLAEVISGLKAFKCVRFVKGYILQPLFSILFVDLNEVLFPARTTEIIIFSAITLFKIG